MVYRVSDIVSLKDIAKVVGRIVGDRESKDTRPVILVGHDIAQDLKYLKMIGYNHWHVPHIVDEVDTKDMHQRMNRSFNGRGLSGVCGELGIHGRNYHNAGNDAVYTLQAMIAMAVRFTAEGSDRKNSFAPGYTIRTHDFLATEMLT
jgi:DNA polymerase III alpha subunit (gram-positive type)